jgi:hypothetical protein
VLTNQHHQKDHGSLADNRVMASEGLSIDGHHSR